MSKVSSCNVPSVRVYESQKEFNQKAGLTQNARLNIFSIFTIYLMANSPVSSRMRMRAKRSGYSASTPPGTFMVIEALKKPEIFCSTRLSKVELHALATLAVPTKIKILEVNVMKRNNLSMKIYYNCRMLLTYYVGEDEVPPCDECPDFSNSHVAIKICRACFGDTCTKLSVAQASQHGGQSSNQKAEDNCRSCPIPGNFASKNIDTSTKRGAHAQGDEVQGGQATGELCLLTGKV